jgi:hypothetical protein
LRADLAPLGRFVEQIGAVSRIHIQRFFPRARIG